MARYASQRISANYIPTNTTVPVKLNGVVVVFTSKTYSSYPDNYFKAENDSNKRLQNAAELRDCVQAYLFRNAITDLYQVAVHDYIPVGSTLRTYDVVITAKQYGSAYNFDPSGNVVTNDDPPTVTPAITHAVCFGSSTGSVSIAVSGGYGPYTIQWADNSTATTRSNIPAGTYTVTVTDSAPVTTYDPEFNPLDHPGVTVLEVVIQQNSLIEILGTLGNDSITLAVSGGIAPYTYKWADGPTTKDRSGLTSGSYSVTVTDSVSCQRAVTFQIDTERFYFSKNPVLLNLTATSPGTKPNLTFLCEVWVEDVYLSGTYTKVVELEQPADSNGSTTFDVSEFLDVYLRPHFPAFGQKTLARADLAFKRFYLKHREKFGTPPVPDTLTTQDVRYVVCGGLDFEEYAAQTFFTSFLTYVKSFFTWEPTAKKVFPEQPEYLYYLHTGNQTGSVSVKLKLFLEGATSETFNLFTTTVKKFELWYFPAGYSLLNLKALAGTRTVTSYQIWVENTATQAIYSEVRTFTPDYRYFRQKRFFMFANSIGGINTLPVTGARVQKLPVATETTERLLVPGYDPALGSVQVASKTGTNVWQVGGGYELTADQRRALQDFRLSEEVRYVDADRYRAGQVVIKSDEVLDEFEPVQPFEFEFIRPASHRYTPTLKKAGYVIPVPAIPEPIGGTNE